MTKDRREPYKVSSDRLKNLLNEIKFYPKSISQLQRIVEQHFRAKISRERARELLKELRISYPVNYLPKNKPIPEKWIRKAKRVCQNEYGYVLEVKLKDGTKKTFTLGADKILNREEIERRAKEGWRKKQKEYMQQGKSLPDIDTVRILDAYASLEVFLE